MAASNYPLPALQTSIAFPINPQENLKMKKYISTLTLVTATLGALAQYTPVEELFYSIENNEVTITGADLNTTRLSIPPTIEGFPVTRIGYAAFEYTYDNITSLILPASVTHIETAAFNLTNLQTIEIPGVTHIGDYAFTGCASLTNLTFPSTLTSIGLDSFYGCTSLTSITLPASLTSIGDSAFHSCTSLTSVTLPASLTCISDQAFTLCTSLTDVIFLGNAPTLKGTYVFDHTPATAYIYEGATGFGDTFGGLSVVVLTSSVPLTLDSITLENGNLIIKPTNGTDGITIEQTDDLVEGTWTPLTPTIVDGCFQLPINATYGYFRLSQ
jgi:hypothetical protein